MKKTIAVLVLVLATGIGAPRPAHAQCENPLTAIPAMVQWILTTQATVANWITTGQNFITEMLTNTATYEVESRLHEFDTNYTNSLADFATRRFVPALQDQTEQWHTTDILLRLDEGAMIDAQLFNEKQTEKKILEAEAQRRYMPSELACQVDTTGHSLTKSFEHAKNLNRGLTKDDAGRISNAQGTASETGRAHEMNVFFQEYVANFCDNRKGDQGCTTPGTYPGQHKDIPSLLWGNKQTIDMSEPGNQLIVNASLRYLAAPASPEVIPPTVVEAAAGKEALLARRATKARINTVYHTLGQMLAERSGGSGLNVQAMRAKAGMSAPESSTNASYSEIQEVMNRERFYDPDYIIKMVGSPAQVVREQGAINAIRLQRMSDMYRRMEEMMFVEAAVYANDLDKQKPSSAVQSAPLTGP